MVTSCGGSLPAERPELLIVYIDAGGGHRAAARALTAAAEETGAPFGLRLLPLAPILAPADFTRRLTGVSMEDAYNSLVRSGRTGFLVPMLRALHVVLRLRHRTLVGLLAAELARHRPAAIVSVTPNFNAVIRDAARAAHPRAPFVVMLTDLADLPPHFWIEPGIDRAIVPTGAAVEQAVALGVPRERVSQTSGVPLHPRFAAGANPHRHAIVREELGFTEHDFVVLLLFGGKGAPEMAPLAEALVASAHGLRVIAICGDNPALYAALTPLETRARGRLRRFGFTERVGDFLSAADLLVTKPGPGSLAEAFACRVPVVVTSNGRTIPQERWNARFVKDAGLGLVVRRWQEIPRAVGDLATDAVLREGTRRNLAALPRNRGVYEALEILAREIGVA